MADSLAGILGLFLGGGTGMITLDWTRRSDLCVRAVAAAPRTRGDGPEAGFVASWSAPCSPRARGWSLLGNRLVEEVRRLPAPARMVDTGHVAAAHDCPQVE